MGGRWWVGSALTLLCAVCASRIPAGAQTPSDIQTIVARVGARVAEYYRRAQSLICTETSTVLPIQSNWSPAGMSRTVESELRFELAAADSGADANVIRRIVRINGRTPRERDKKDTSGCTDPEALSPAPLDFLLPSHRDEYRFTAVHDGNREGRPAIRVDFKSADSRSKPELREDPRGHDACYQMLGTVATQGRVWVDAETFDVLRVEQHIEGPITIRVPWNMQRRDGLPDIITLDRQDVTLDYKTVAFKDPGESLLLPSSIDEMLLWRGAFQSTRRTTSYSDYHRFVTSGRIVKDEP